MYTSVQELVNRIRKGELSPLELMERTLERIEAVNPRLNAIVALRAEEALEEARSQSEQIAAGEDLGPLSGIPVGVKDLEDVRGMVTSFGSVPYRDNTASRDSVQVARLRSAGAIVVGKTNTPEFGSTAFTKNRLFGVTRNPWHLERTPGGSSGGSAAAVASGMLPLATGSDAGGSIRIPGCYSGCFGLKPTYGRIPLGPFPLPPMSRTMVMGPLTRTVEDAALYLDCVAGYHSADPDSVPSPPRGFYSNSLSRVPSTLRIGFSPTLGYARVQKEIAALAESAAGSFEQMGFRVDEWGGVLPQTDDAWSQLMAGEIYGWVCDRFPSIRSELGRALVSALESAKGLCLDDYLRIQEVRTDLNRVLSGFFESHDLLLTPTMPTEAFVAEGPPPSEIEGEPIPLLGAVAFTYPFNLSGHPATSLRVGFTSSGLPAGLQIVGPRFREDRVLQAALAYERLHPWEAQWPDL